MHHDQLGAAQHAEPESGLALLRVQSWPAATSQAGNISTLPAAAEHCAQQARGHDNAPYEVHVLDATMRPAISHHGSAVPATNYPPQAGVHHHLYSHKQNSAGHALASYHAESLAQHHVDHQQAPGPQQQHSAQAQLLANAGGLGAAAADSAMAVDAAGGAASTLDSSAAGAADADAVGPAVAVILDEGAMADAEAYASDAEAVARGIVPAASGAGGSCRTAPAAAASHGSVDAEGAPGFRTSARHGWQSLVAPAVHHAEAVSGAHVDAPMQDIALGLTPASADGGIAPQPATSVHATMATRGTPSEVSQGNLLKAATYKMLLPKHKETKDDLAPAITH
jgi:hypothetical protein